MRDLLHSSFYVEGLLDYSSTVPLFSARIRLISAPFPLLNASNSSARDWGVDILRGAGANAGSVFVEMSSVAYQ